MILGCLATVLPQALSVADEDIPEPAVEETFVPSPATAGKSGPVYIIPIEGPIEQALLYVIRRGVAEATAKNASAVVFVMDTPGGAVDVTEKIVELIIRQKVPTYTFVEHNAISAGAIVAMATDYIYMAPGSKIGDAMPILMAPGGGVQPLPDAEREKIMSYVDTLVRGVAQRKGRDETMASAMVRPEIEYKIGDDIISKEGQLLTLTNLEAERRYGEDQKPLLSEGTVDNLDDMLALVGLDRRERTELVVTYAERIARFLQLIGPLLMAFGFLGIYLEFQSPGFGWPGTIGIICLLLYFAGHHIAGLAGNEEILIFLLGVALILIEVFLLPGFGIAGVTGILLILWALLNSMIERLPGDPWMPPLPAFKIPMFKLALSIIGATVGGMILGKYLPRSSVFHRLVLDEATARDAGYSASHDKRELLGQEGVTVGPLYPAGTIRIGDQRVDVVTRGEFIKEGVKVRVVETHGNRIIVEAVEETAG